MKLVTYFTSLAMIFTALSFANESALIAAAKNSDLAKVKAAVAAGENVNAVGKGGATALMWASKNNNNDMVDFLLAKGADVNAQDSAGYSALIYASI